MEKKSRWAVMVSPFEKIPQGARVSYDADIDLGKVRKVTVTYTPDGGDSLSLLVPAMSLQAIPDAPSSAMSFTEGASAVFSFLDTPIELTREALGQSVANIMLGVREEDKRENAGLWYLNDYNKTYLSTYKQAPSFDCAKGWANPEYFDLLPPRNRLRLKPNKSASKALIAFFEGLTITECYSVIMAAHYATICRVIGKERCDRLFGSEQQEVSAEQRLFIEGAGTSGAANPLLRFLRKLTSKEKEGSDPIQIGDWAYFGNHPDYGLKHRRGSASGWNVVCVGENADKEKLWRGFGFTKNLREQELLEMMAQEYNEPQTEEDKDAEREWRRVQEPVSIFPMKYKDTITVEDIRSAQPVSMGIVLLVPGYNSAQTQRLSLTKLKQLLQE